MKTLYINYSGSEKRVAVEEEKEIVELLWQRNEQAQIFRDSELDEKPFENLDCS